MAEKIRGKVAAVMIKNKKIYLVRQKGNDMFGLPGGGIEYGETVEDAIKREIKEETCCRVNSYRFFQAYLSGDLTKIPQRLGNFIFLVDFTNIPRPSNEIVEIIAISYEERSRYPISPTALAVIEDCRLRGLL